MIGPLLALAAVADAPPPEIRQPTGKWVVDFGEAQCVAYRDYGTKDDPLFLVLKAPPVGSVMQLAVIRPGGGMDVAEQVYGKIVVDGRDSIRTTMLTYALRKEKKRIVSVNLPLAEFERIRSSKMITVDARRRQDTFAIDKIEPLLRVVEKCVSDLRTIWHVNDDPADEDSEEVKPHPALQSGAMGTLTSLFSGDDYPADAFVRVQQGTARIAILVNELGRVADCTVIETSGVAALDAQSCALIQKRARFKPAIDKAGKPAKDAFVQSITWRLE